MAGRRIDDHSSWIGAAGKNMVMPMGVHTKQESSAEGAGGLSTYEDTTESIKSQQEMGIKKAKAHPHKVGYRN
jgi:hypothetical protein